MLGKALVLLCLISLVTGDIYMHNPRGSNDRLNEESTNRNNANRLFDSQNNAKGGYAIAPFMHYYAGSVLEVQWTNQHGCGDNDKTNCQVVIQYMCGDDVRDGTTTNTIPDDENAYRELVTISTEEEFRFYRANGDDETQVYRYGMHESYEYYQACKTRSRNKGLFTADRNVGASARSTRQNNGGTRRGFECSEERDYYPYWHPSPWIDIAILDDTKDRCKMYSDRSQNKDAKNYCENNIANNEAECIQQGSLWLNGEESDGGDVDCDEGPLSRANHLGDGRNGKSSTYRWIIPGRVISEFCVLRIRYNISTQDYNAWDIDSESNGDASPVKQDPSVSYGEIEDTVRNLTLALDTSQFGRTFQDRSHTFAIRDASGSDKGKRIYNLNVRGKRGNIVQTYPAIEYDFCPPVLNVKESDLVHVQWTGSDFNPAGNDGEGRNQLDRSNLVTLDGKRRNKPIEHGDSALLGSDDELLFAHLGQETCLTYEELEAKHNGNAGNIAQDEENCMVLNAAAPYFNAGTITMETSGSYHFMCTRNNNFTNRSQKGSITVDPFLPAWAIALVVVSGAVCLAAIVVSIIGFVARLLPDSKLNMGWRKINFMKDPTEEDVAED